MNKEELRQRLLDFSYKIILLSRKILDNRENNIILKQLIRSSTSIGANYNEALNACSRRDFVNKLYLIKKEAQETDYWLSLLYKCNPKIKVICNLNNECIQITKIFQKSISTIKTNEK